MDLVHVSGLDPTKTNNVSRLHSHNEEQPTNIYQLEERLLQILVDMRCEACDYGVHPICFSLA